MQSKFIYVFDTKTRDILLAKGHQVLKADDKQNVFVFENCDSLCFALRDIEGCDFAFSNTLTF